MDEYKLAQMIVIDKGNTKVQGLYNNGVLQLKWSSKVLVKVHIMCVYM